MEDDGAKPGQGNGRSPIAFLNNEKIKIFTGIVFSNVAGATVPDVLDAGAVYVSPNAGPSTFAGKGLPSNYFVVSWQNDSLHESAGQLANELGYKRVYLVWRRNYQAGKDALEGFKRFYKGKIAGESLHPSRPDRLRRSSRRSARPDRRRCSSSNRAASGSRSCASIEQAGSDATRSRWWWRRPRSMR